MLELATQPRSQLVHTRVKFYAYMNSAKVLKLPSHCSPFFLQIA